MKYASRKRWESNIKMDVRIKGVIVRIWMDSAHHSDNWRGLVNGAVHLWLPETMELVN